MMCDLNLGEMRPVLLTPCSSLLIPYSLNGLASFWGEIGSRDTDMYGVRGVDMDGNVRGSYALQPFAQGCSRLGSPTVRYLTLLLGKVGT
jgi:hypothetical protein